MSRRARRRLKAAGVGVVAVAVASGVAVFALSASKPDTPPPVSQKVQDYYNNPPSSRTTDGKLVVSRPLSGPLKVVFAGDSLTYGLFASSEAKGYRPQVVAALEESGPVVATRGGQSGNTVKTVADSITFPADADLVVLALGTNDVWKTKAPDMAKQYEALVTKVRTSAPDASIMCVGVWSNADGARIYNPLIQRACEVEGGKFLRINDLFEVPANRGPAGRASFGGTSDAFHPNDTGYAAIASRLIAGLTIK